MTQTYFQKGFGLKAEGGPVLGYDAVARDIRVTLAREFGFCYGVGAALMSPT